MSTSDITSLVSLIVAVLAFVIALLTFVVTVVTGPSVSMLIGQYVSLSYSSDKKNLFLLSNFTFFNGGAQPGALIELSGTLSAVGGSNKVGLFWDTFVEVKNIAKPGERANLFTEATGPIQTIIVPGRAAGEGGVQWGIILFSDELKMPVISSSDKGSYTLILTGLIKPGRTKRCKARSTLVIASADHARYLDTCVPNPSTGLSDDMLYLRRQERPRKNLVSRLLIPAEPFFVSEDPEFSPQQSGPLTTTDSQS